MVHVSRTVCEPFSRHPGVTISPTDSAAPQRHAPVDTDPLQLPALLRPVIEAERDHAEQIRKPPAALVDALRDAGAFRLITPRELGGFELPLPELLRLYFEFGRLDASTGLLVWNYNFGFLGAYLPESAVERIWANGPSPLFANSGRPNPVRPVAGGFRLSGRWNLVTGIDSAEWICLVALVHDGDQPRVTAEGGIDIKVCVVPRADVEVIDDWYSNGVGGSGSASVAVDDLFVPDDLVMAIDAPERIDRPLYRLPVTCLVFPSCAAVLLGVARAAIDEVVSLLREKPGENGRPLAELPRVQSAIARADADLRAAELFLRSIAEELYAAAASSTPVELDSRGAMHAAMGMAGRVGRDVLVSMYELGSSTPVYTGNRLERVFRDGMTVAQHANVAASHDELAGRILLGVDPGTPLV
jgi:indole-3-acetate monooxygenase